MRVSITNCTIGQVMAVGGINIKTMKSLPIIYADLTDDQISRLREQGCVITLAGKVVAGIVTPSVKPPTPPGPAPGPVQTYYLTSDDIRKLTGTDTLQNTPVSPPGSTTTPPTTETPGTPTTAPLPPVPPLSGKGVGVAIIDTGIRETHSMLQGRVVYSKNYTADPMADNFRHGTSVASLAVAVAPMCDILNLKVMGDNGEGKEEDVVQAIDDCISFHDTQSRFAPRVINLSFGSPDVGQTNAAMQFACREALDRGIWILAAAGNSGPEPGTILSPACEHYVLAVGSVKYMLSENSFIVSDFSSRGPTREGLNKPDMVMFGENISVATSDSDTSTEVVSGTSFSTAFCSGLTILYLEGKLKLAGFDPGQAEPLPAESYAAAPSSEAIVNQILEKVCIKPAGMSTAKDNAYGNGLLYGLSVSQLLQQTGAAVTETSVLSQAITGIMMVMMVGMMMKSMKPALTKVGK